MSGPVFVVAPAKVNLFLHVGEKRDDGYHALQSLVAFTKYGDEISFDHNDRFLLSLNGPFGAQLSDGEENLVLRAARLLAEKTGVRDGARICLHKNLPVASGIGGGSADAAAVLRGLTRLWQIDLGPDRLREIGASLGADVPVCIESTTSWMEGRGEHVRRLPPLPEAGVLLVNPGVQVSTAQVFSGLGLRHGVGMSAPAAAFPDVGALARYLRDTTSDLEGPAQKIAPVVADVLRAMDALPDALLARMSGSGATCFGLFANKKAACTAGTLLRARHTEWWICETVFSAR